MPARPINWDRPTFYLDHSTLCSAFRAHFIGGKSVAELPAFRPLYDWIGRVANEANLCFSQWHTLELAGWPDESSRRAMAEWLEGLPLVWFAPIERLRHIDVAYWLRRAYGIEAERLNPFATCVVDAQLPHPSPTDIAELLTVTDIADLVAAHVRRPVGVERRLMHDVARWGRHLAARAREQRLTNAELRARADQDWRTHVRWLAQEANKRLQDDVEYVAAVGASGQHPVDKLEAYVGDHPEALALARVETTFVGAVMADGVQRAPGSASRTEFDSATLDGLHACAAAYCGTFTCDRTTQRRLGDVRRSLGLSEAIALGGDLATSVAGLMATWP